MSVIRKPKLELTWIGKENRPRLEPRILLEDTERAYHAKHRVSGKNLFDNRLIFGDNLLAPKALEQEFTGKVKCVVIDPPYNTGSAFEHYDDGVEHSLWLKNIYASGELTPEATISKMEIVQDEGGRQVARTVEFYNLDAVIAVG